MKYKRIVLKLSGEALTGSKHSNIDPAVLEQYSAEIKAVKEQGKEIAIVIGGGKNFRGGPAEARGNDRVHGGYIGMAAHGSKVVDPQKATGRGGNETRRL